MANNSTYYRADYTTSLYFKLPAGTNLDDTTVVEEYWIRGGILYVLFSFGWLAISKRVNRIMKAFLSTKPNLIESRIYEFKNIIDFICYLAQICFTTTK